MPVDPVATRRFIEALSTHLEDHLALWKSSLADARREVESVLTTAGERIPAQAKSLFPEDVMTMLLEDALPAPPPPEKVVETVVERVIERVEVPVPTGSLDWSLVRGSIAAVESARTQVDVLSRFLSEANAHASRVALLVLRGDRLSGWKGIGFEPAAGREDGVKGLDVAAPDDPLASEVLRRERSVLAEPPDEQSPLRRALGGRPPARTLVVPMVIRDRVAGLLIADELQGEEGRLSEAALETLTFVTGLAVDLLAARKKIPSPTLTPTGEEVLRWTPPAPAAPPPVETPVPEDPAAMVQAIPIIPPVPDVQVEPEPRPAQPAAPPPPVSSPPSASYDETDTSSRSRRRNLSPVEALRALEESTGRAAKRAVETSAEGMSEAGGVPRNQLRPPTPELPSIAPPAPPTPPVFLAPAGAPPSPAEHRPASDLTMAFDQMRGAPPPRPAPAPLAPPPAAPSPAPAPPPVQAPAAPPRQAPAADSTATGGVVPPPGFVPRGLAGRPTDPQRQIEDARRLARLLVSEIKLYNEKKVEEGRANGNLYELLKDDIDRSRQVYVERTPESIRENSDFFREELVRVLAEGRPDVLGAPGA